MIVSSCPEESTLMTNTVLSAVTTSGYYTSHRLILFVYFVMCYFFPSSSPSHFQTIRFWLWFVIDIVFLWSWCGVGLFGLIINLVSLWCCNMALGVGWAVNNIALNLAACFSLSGEWGRGRRKRTKCENSGEWKWLANNAVWGSPENQRCVTVDLLWTHGLVRFFCYGDVCQCLFS